MVRPLRDVTRKLYLLSGLVLLTLKVLIDNAVAYISPFLGLLFLVPIVNWITMIVLALVPSVQAMQIYGAACGRR